MCHVKNESIRVNGSAISLVVDGQVLDAADADDVTRLYVIKQENALYQGDEPFYAVVVGRAVWVVPYFTPGVRELLVAIRPALERRRGVTLVRDAKWPWSWRRRWLGFLPLFPVPGLGRHRVSSLPAWSADSGHAVSEYPDLFNGDA
jgi:hypothetical protein